MRAIDDPTLWRKVHNLWISEIYAALKPQVAGRLSLAIDQEVTLIDAGTEQGRMRPDLHASRNPSVPAKDQPATVESHGSRAIAYAEGIETWSSESRHFVVLRDLAGGRVVGVLEVLSPTNKGYYGRSDRESFWERRQRLLQSPICYLEIDAVPHGERWLPRSLGELAPHAGVAWTSAPDATARRFRGWAWSREGPLPEIPWDLGEHGAPRLDLDRTLSEAAAAGGITG